jgi:anti-sigma regulatory factor (Ser/Thr protein kinase)
MMLLSGNERKAMEITFKNFHRYIDAFIKMNRGEYWDLREYSYIEPIGLVVLKSIALDLGLSNVPYLDPLNENACGYLDAFFNRGYDPSKSYIPVEVVKNYDREYTKEKIVSKILGFGDFSKLSLQDKADLKEYLSYMLGEVLDNAIFHASSSIGAVVGGQLFHKQGKLQIVVVDRGVGFLKNLKREYSVKTEAEAIQEALKKGVSSPAPAAYTSTYRHAGYGLYVLKEIIKHTDGELLIISNNDAVRYIGKKDKIIQFPNVSKLWKGAIVAFEFYEENINYSLQEFLNIYVHSEDSEDEEFFF